MTNPMVCTRCGQPHGACRGHNRAGNPCGRGTKGLPVCPSHGGAAPQVIRAGERRQAQEKARKLLWKVDAAPVVDAVDALQRFAGRLLAAEEMLGDKVNDLVSVRSSTTEDAEQVRGEVQVLMEFLKLIRATLVDITKLGLEERQVRLTERAGEALIGLLDAGSAALGQRFGFDGRDPLVQQIWQEQLHAIEGRVA